MIRDLWEFPGRTIGQRVLVYAATDSTNNRAAEHSGQPGLAFLADEPGRRFRCARRYVA
jgi:hypothetical protein